ncbi:RagB/SusD family nutrient uptake outer membrane protein [uncultured Sunxiuqinia sp.]|uniref:RagB/SusD family nutrient uptake outer membrane protein n=1 Tax=uncultured Sunxiuqinia sp. TaxID=1573825 RepID=UPI0030D8D52E|tara:strand:- start:37243 stop:38757 length:1515 start_codon:yes stop_codon:yes gene_type:complete
MKTVYCILTIAFLGLTSCSESFLELDNPNKVTSNAYWNTEADLAAGLATAYNSLVDDYNGHWGVVALELKEGRTENFQIRNDVRGRFDVSTYQNTISTGETANFYKGCYTGIFRCNQVIHFADQVQGISDAKKAELVAEAKFIRGLQYFILAIDFGAVPVITSLAESREDYFNEKATEEQVWTQVISDLEDAKAALPVTRPDDQLGRATKGAAIGFLGRAHLYLEDWPQVITELGELVTNESQYGYGLMPNFADNFVLEHENNQESVFELQYSLQGGPDIWTGNPANKSRSTFIAQECAPGEVGGWFELFPTSVLLDAMLEEKTTEGDFDPRATATLAWNYPGCVFYQRDFSTSFESDAIWLRKNQNWWNENEGDWKSELNEKGMRYSDVLLMLAEAYTMEGQVGNAAPLVQRVRSRANLVDKQAEMAGWSSDQMMEEIMHQRNVEFAREGLRFYDLRRWGKLQEVIAASQVEGYSNFSSKYEYYPIPESELENNPSITQNGSW